MSGATTTYLQLYNGISALLWFVVLARTCLLTALLGPSHVYGGVGEWTRNVQTLALLEVLHSALGLVRSPLFTTALQVVSRLVIVWTVCLRYPTLVATSPAYSSMLLAWSLTEVVRYTYFAFSLLRSNSSKRPQSSSTLSSSSSSSSASNRVPHTLVWLRYSMFYVLYPLGIGSECWLVWRAKEPAAMETGDERVKWVVYAVLGLYVPGSYVLYNHMRRQRARVLKGKRKPM